jgi:hypothetical protein
VRRGSVSRTTAICRKPEINRIHGDGSPARDPDDPGHALGYDRGPSTQNVLAGGVEEAFWFVDPDIN